MELSGRKKDLLRAVTELHIETAEPVGSKAVAERSGLRISSATVRNEMAELESMGYLSQPHKSAGRVPTPAGYRLYVNELMDRSTLPAEEINLINSRLNRSIEKLDFVISDAGRLTSQLTNYPSYAFAKTAADVTVSRFDLIYVDETTFIIVLLLSNELVKNKLVHFPFKIDSAQLVKISTLFNTSFVSVTEDKITSALISATERAAGDGSGLVAVVAGYTIEVLIEAKKSETYISGTANLLKQPEFHDPNKAQRLLEYLLNYDELPNLPSTGGASGINITIGPENVAEELRDSSVMVASYDIGDDMQGLIGVVGPTRMDYSKVAAKLSYIARGIGALFSNKGIENALSGKTGNITLLPKSNKGDEDIG
jgi:heat-inducible transcriptional repressor